MRQTHLVLLYVLGFLFFGCSPKYGIKKTHAYIRTTTAGNIPVDDQNRPQTRGVQKTYLVYLEVKDTISKPQWDTAWMKEAAFGIQVLKIEKEKIIIGKTAKNQTEVTLTPQAGYHLWQLLLTPLPQSPQPIEIQNKLQESEIVLTGSWKGNKASYTIKEIVELERIFME